MLTETQHQLLLEEATGWVSHLATYVEAIKEMKDRLYKCAAGKKDRDELVQIEHFHNQFHIQLINLHDLKHSIRGHMRALSLTPEANHSEKHEQLEGEYAFLIHDLDNLKAEFSGFIS
jgi:chromosome segregation ATPase